MKISIITPVYNASKYLKKMIESVLSQTYDNFELILVDDGSKDDSYEIMCSYSDNDKVKVYKKENSGPGFTRKYGYEKSNGELLFFVDSDDWLENNLVLEKINNIFEKNNIDLLIFDRKTYPAGKVLPPFSVSLESGYHKIDSLDGNIIRGGLGLKVFKSSIFDSKMFSDSSNYEDFFSTYLYLDKCNNFYYESDVFYAVNRCDDNISLTKKFSCEHYLQGMTNVINMYNIVKNQALKNSISTMAFNVYISNYLVPIFKFKLKFSDLKKINKIRKELKKIIKKNKIIKKMSLKKKLVYILFIR